jgi:hypothetical protein
MVQDDPRLVAWLHQINAGIPRHAWTDVPDMIARVLVNGDTRLVFLLNTRATPTTATLSVPRKRKTTPHIRELITDTAVTPVCKTTVMTLRVKLGPYGTRVYAVNA